MKMTAKQLLSLLRKVPARYRGWAYLAAAVVGVAVVGVQLYQGEISVEGLVAAVLGGLARANLDD